MKPIPPMTRAAKEARRQKAKMKHSMTEQEAIAKGPPKEGHSISSCQIFAASPSEWVYAHGAGWYHISEVHWFLGTYEKSGISNVWFKVEEMITVFKSDVRVAESELEGLGYAVCALSGRACPKSGMSTVTMSTGKTTQVADSYVTNGDHFLKCKVTNGWVHREAIIRVNNPITEGWTHISRFLTKTQPSHFAECPNCGHTQELAGILSRPQASNEMMCNDCWIKFTRKNVIRKHDCTEYPSILSSKPTNRLLVKGKVTNAPDESVRLFGVECEVEIMPKSPMDRYELAMAATEVLGKDFIVMKNDGSLKNHPRESPLWGFEMVTAPADLKMHREKWSKLEAMKGFKELRAWDTTTCGMHVHVGKAGLTTLQIGRIMMFITTKFNRKFIEKVAGRNSEAACRFVDKGIDGGLKPDPDKYCAINIRPTHTIEFRIFRGTIRYQHIIRNLEFCEAVCAYCHPASRAFVDVKDYRKFLEYCSENRKLYPFLTKWMAHPDQAMIKPLAANSRKLNPKAAFDVVEPVPTETRSQERWY